MRTRGVRSLSSILVLRRLVGNSYSSMVMSPRTSSDIVAVEGCGFGFNGRRFRKTGWSEDWRLGSTETWRGVAGEGKQILLNGRLIWYNVRQGCTRRATAGIGRKGSVATLEGYAGVEVGVCGVNERAVVSER